MLTLNITGGKEMYETEDLINGEGPSIWRSMRRTSQKEEIKSSNSQDSRNRKKAYGCKSMHEMGRVAVLVTENTVPTLSGLGNHMLEFSFYSKYTLGS